MPNIASHFLRDFYFSTPMREGILNWYPFACDATVLECSGGALTHLLVSRCKEVTSFSESYGGENKFNYVVCIDPQKITTELLRQYHAYLNPHGRLLLAFENPFGLRFFSGKRNPRTDLPFTFWEGASKRSVEIMLNQAGFKGQKWYFPTADHWFAREIYSQDYMPNQFLNMRKPIYAEWDYTSEFDERWMWSEVIRNGAFEFLCNAYLVEARVCPTDQACGVDFAAVTAYREHSKAFLTTVHNDGTARKQAIFPEGVEQLKRMSDNHTELLKMGVNALPVTLNGNALIMKRLDIPTLWDYMAQKLVEKTFDETELFGLFDRLRDEIAKSSRGGKCYWEMVPANCFYDETKNELIFFDQEYCWENIDPDVALVRAIYALIYSYEFQNDSRTNDWIAKLKERYRLSEKWDQLAEVADKRTSEFVFNTANTAPLERATKRVREHADERLAERNGELAATRARFSKMCVAADCLKTMNVSHPAVYGYGIRGKMLRQVLEMNAMDVACIIDKAKPIVRGIPLFSNIKEISDDAEIDVIIVTPAKDGMLIAEELRKTARCPVMTLEELVNG